MATEQAQQHTTECVGADFQFAKSKRRGPQQHAFDNPNNSLDSDHSSLSAVYSLSDMSLSSSSCSEVDEMRKTDLSAYDSDGHSHKKNSSNFLFLPPSSNISHNSSELPYYHWALPSQFADCKSLDSVGFPSDNKRPSPCIANTSNSLKCSSGHMIPSNIFEFDFVSMKEKLEAQREYLLGSFQKQQGFPQILTVQPKIPHVQKPTSLKMKEKLHKFGRSARRFLSYNILRRHHTIQRCEIELQGFDDRVERLLLFISHKSSEAHQVYMYIPSFFETNRVILPKWLLPSKPVETMTVTVYGITVVYAENEISPFSELLLSGVCTIHPDAVLLKGRLELQPHRPCHSLTSHSKAVQSCGSGLVVEHSGASSYIFATHPKPVAQNFTEVCVLQAAQPFHEYFSMSASSCDHPASFQTQLSPGKYHAICSYRTTNNPNAGTYTVTSATPCIFFKAYMDKASAADTLKATLAELGHRANDAAYLLLSSLSVFKPLHLDMETLMETLHTRQGKPLTNSKPTKNDLDMKEEALYMPTWDIGVVQPTTAVSESSLSPRKTTDSLRPNSSLSIRNNDCILLPSLSIFNMNTQLYFADRWTYYEKLYITLVLCKKGSPCQQVCKQNFPKLDPYDNPFFFRKRCFDPEPNITVHASANVNVEIIYSNSSNIQKLISTCSENVYFSKIGIRQKQQLKKFTQA